MSNNWNGIGLPETGSECEYEYTADGQFCKCRIMGYNGISIAFTRDDAANRIFVSTIKEMNFRPIESDRDKAIEEMLSHMQSGWTKDIAAELYDAGYRKQSGE